MKSEKETQVVSADEALQMRRQNISISELVASRRHLVTIDLSPTAHALLFATAVHDGFQTVEGCVRKAVALYVGSLGQSLEQDGVVDEMFDVVSDSNDKSQAEEEAATAGASSGQ